MQFTDSHAHLYDEVFEDDFDEILEKSFKNEVKRVVVPSTDRGNHQKVKELTAKYSNTLFAAYGVHPTSVNECEDIYDELTEVEKYISDPNSKAVAVGEAGLDLFWSKDYVENQLICFREQAKMAIHYNLPMIIHCREAFELLHSELPKFNGDLRGVIHGFSGTVEDYLKIKSYGDFFFGIGGVVTFKNSNLKEVVAQMKLEDIVLETDAPYLTPVPYRGKRNEPSHIALIAQFIAQNNQCDIETVAEISEKNCNKLFFSTTK